jgi:hypothetical protein
MFEIDTKKIAGSLLESMYCDLRAFLCYFFTLMLITGGIVNGDSFQIWNGIFWFLVVYVLENKFGGNSFSKFSFPKFFKTLWFAYVSKNSCGYEKTQRNIKEQIEKQNEVTIERNLARGKDAFLFIFEGMDKNERLNYLRDYFEDEVIAVDVDGQGEDWYLARIMAQACLDTAGELIDGDELIDATINKYDELYEISLKNKHQHDFDRFPKQTEVDVLNKELNDDLNKELEKIQDKLEI